MNPSSWLIDTNVLLRFAFSQDVHHDEIRSALDHLTRTSSALLYTPQNLVEFWNVATRPLADNGYGLSPMDADGLLSDIEARFTLLPDSPLIHPEWRRLVLAHNVRGRQVHDARLAAAMRVHGVTHLLTLNPSDFPRYGIAAVLPASFRA